VEKRLQVGDCLGRDNEALGGDGGALRVVGGGEEGDGMQAWWPRQIEVRGVGSGARQVTPPSSSTR
jgi:hypothetical protein